MTTRPVPATLSPLTNRRRAAIVVLAVLVLSLTLGIAGVLAYTPPTQVNFTLQGCNNSGNILLPIGGQYVCPDAAYTTGNLGKGWNELDLVPHRLTSSVGTQANATTTYNVIIAADYLLGGKVGYDVISAPVVNAAKSHASCSITVGPELVASGVTGGVDDVKYRVLTISQDKGTTCVFDYYQRLALGASQYSGSSLQAYMFESENFQTGRRTIPIPVKEILPQELDKDMAATQDTDYAWNLTKSPTPASLNFGDTCASTAPASLPVTIRIDWDILPGTPGMVTVITNIYATNPAARIITINVTDVIYGNLGSGQVALDTANSGDIDVPANTANFLVLTHTYAAPANVTGLNDVATATYTDKVTGVPVPGQTTATASAAIQPGAQTNTTATIADSETITGTGLMFSTDSFAPAVGTFTGGYVAGTKTVGPVGWLSNAQSADGYVEFSKTVYINGPIITTGSLDDTAVLTASQGFTASANASVNISSSALVKLTIHKTIPNVLTGGETATFTFTVKDAADSVVAAPSITFAAGETSKSVTVSGLLPGAYTVGEDPATGWQAQAPQNVAINLPSCAGSVTFNNTFTPASAKARKVTIPAGNEAGWEFTLSGPGGPETVTTTGAGAMPFALVLQEGNYTITETAKPGFDQTAATGCSFTVDYPADAGKVFECVITNTQRGKILVDKVTVPPGASQQFEFDPSYGPNFFLTDADAPHDSGYLVPGTYSVAEVNVPAGWTLDSAVCSDGSPVNAISLQPGETVTCTFTNSRDTGSLKILKTLSNPDGAPVPASFTVNYNCGPGYTGQVSVAQGSPATVSGIPTGSTCTVTEVAPAAIPGYTWGPITYTPESVVIAADEGVYEITVGNSITRDRGSLKIIKSVIGGGAGFTGSFGVKAVCNGTTYNETILYPDPGFVIISGIPTGLSCTVTETSQSAAPSGYSWLGTVQITGSPAVIVKDTTKEVTVTNTVTGRAKVVKTKAGLPPAGADAFTFQLRQGASTVAQGTILETQIANAGNGGLINFAYALVPGQTYQLCEVVMPGWNTSLGDYGVLFVPESIIPPVLPNPNVDNSTVCVNFTAVAGETTSFTVDNTYPGGMARTIGFWKNWASCAKSNGNQAPVLDQTMQIAENAYGGIVMSADTGTYPLFGPTFSLILHDTNANPDVASDCLKAVRLLSKQVITTGKNKASDPAFNLAAQLLAAQLNFAAGAYQNGTVINAVNQAVLVLGKYDFNGVTHKTISKADVTLMNNLAKILDQYNNNNL